MKFEKVIAGVVTLGACFAGSSALGQDLTTSRVNVLGRPGILEMPTAEVAPDGQIALSYGQFGPVKRTTLTFQLAPRISGSFRYSGTKDLTSTYDVYWDRSFDLSYLLLKEGQYRPAVSIGLQDFLGTGLLSGEYIVATKSVGEKLRVTGGLGWGRLASHNALGVFSGERDTSYIETGGTFNVDQWFRGDVAAFGGLTYQVNDKLTLLAEYSSDAYTAEVDAGIFDHNSPLNFGVDYQLGSGTAVSAYYLHGSEIGLSFSASVNPKSTSLQSGGETAPLPVLTRPSRRADPEGWSGAWQSEVGDGALIQKALSGAMEKEGLRLEAMSLDVTSVEIRYSNTRFGARAQALGRLSRIMTRAFPPSVETFTLTETLEGVPVHSTIIMRSDLEKNEFEPASVMLDTVQFVDSRTTQARTFRQTENAFPRKLWSISPYLATSVFDPDSPLRVDLGLRGALNYEFAPGFSIDTSATVRLTGNISDQEEDGEESVLYPVRTSADRYDDVVQLEKLTANWYSHPAENIFGRVTVGYFEKMYGGVSGELLWKQPNSRLALGAEVNYAVQRDYDNALGFLDYDILTGHVSGYYAFDNGYHGQVDVGRYLAGDWGTTVSVDREFNNGWRVGAYATLTDVPFEDFGEGSFDKGIRVTIPADWFTGTPTTQSTDLVLKSLNRDGGARVDVTGRLYDRVRNLQGSEIDESWGRFWR